MGGSKAEIVSGITIIFLEGVKFGRRKMDGSKW